MASLEASFNWNSGDTGTTHDFSGNGRVSEGMVAITIGSGVVGSTAIFNGSTSTIKFGDTLDAGGLDTISCLFHIKKASSKLQALSFRSKNVQVLLNADDTVSFGVQLATELSVVTSIGTIDTSARTIECVYDGTGGGFQGIYIDGILDTSIAKTGLIIASPGANFVLGHHDFGSDTLFFDGEMEVVDCRSDALNAEQVLAWHENPLGTEYEFQNVHKLLLGDIVAGGKIFELALPEISGSVSFVLDTKILRIKPISKQFNLNDVPVQRGNILDDARQWLSEYQIVDGEPIFQIRDRINELEKSAPNFEASKGIRLTKDHSIFKNAIVPDFVLEPSAEPAQIDDFAPTDIEFCNTLYISSTTPVTWSGLLAPNPVRRQFMFVVNVGSFNVTARNNNAGSIPANRFQINGNVIFGPEEMGFALYDVGRSRWRLNKI